MTSAGEVFVVQLARASRKAKRIIRHLPRADREDILANALAWCWQNRENYSLTTSLDTWFCNAVRDAYKAWERGETKEATEVIEDIGVPDDTSARAQALQAIERIQEEIAKLPELEQRIAVLIMRQWSRDEICERLHVGFHAVTSVRARLQPLQRLIPESDSVRFVVRRASSTSSDDVSADLAPIDEEIERLDFPPPHGSDCPPCWRCKWFEGYLPGDHRSVRAEVVEPEVRDAIERTEARKISIAQEVRNGDL